MPQSGKFVNLKTSGNRFGNMLWLSAALTSFELKPDPGVTYEGRIPGCSLCSDICPQQTLEVFQSINKPAGIVLLAPTMVANGALNVLPTERKKCARIVLA